MVICLTGATGFIGKNLLKRLEQRADTEIIALTRQIPPQMDGARKGQVTWRRCNGFSLLEVERATQGCDVLIYLIHSMLPSSALTQGSFGDFDLYLADNFARAAQKNKIKRIIYLGGLIPETDELSLHLLSRMEVENALAQGGNHLITLRAGLIVGKNGSSFKILNRLISRLPLLICPTWTLSRCQPIDLADVLASFEYLLEHPQLSPQAFDIGGPDVLTYREILKTTARVKEKKRWFLSVPFFSPSLSKLWVSKVTTTSHNLVYPLVESLKFDMITQAERQLKLPQHAYRDFETSLREGLTEDPGLLHQFINYTATINIRWLENVTSIQRVPARAQQDAKKISVLYFDFVGRLFWPLMSLKRQGEEVSFDLFKRWPLLILQRAGGRSGPDRELFYVTGGILARKSQVRGRFEFRWVHISGCVLIALQDFRPALPWFIYKYSQALVHLFVMRRFARYLERQT